jgi:hypothetical protein
MFIIMDKSVGDAVGCCAVWYFGCVHTTCRILFGESKLKRLFGRSRCRGYILFMKRLKED